MKHLKLLFVVLLSLLALNCFSQETEPAETDIIEVPETPSSHTVSFIASMGPGMYLNTVSSKYSAPSPIIYPVQMGILWPNYTTTAFEPSLSFFYMYHLYYNNMALPAEIENRTTFTPTFILNLPVAFNFYFGNNRLQVNAGLALVMRFGVKANGVDDSEAGEIEAINKWFWQNARCVYLSTGASWIFGHTKNFKAGPTINIYFPMGTLFSGEGLQGMMATVGMKITL